MVDPLHTAAEKALAKLPYSLATMQLPPVMAAPAGSDPKMRAGVEDGNALSPIYIGDKQNFTNPDYAPQLLGHELYHQKVNNLPPKLRSMLPSGNTNDPYNYGGVEGLKKVNGDPLKLSNEQGAAAMQTMIAARQRGEKLDPIYDTFEQKFGDLPLSVMQPTDPNQKGINTMPRVPGLPSRPVWGTKMLHAKKVIPVPPGSGQDAPDFIPATASADDAPDFIPAQPLDDAGPARPGVPAAPLPEGLTGPSSPNYAGMALKAGNALGNMGIGGIKEVGDMLNGASKLTPFPAPFSSRQVQANTTGQKVGRGIVGAASFLLPGLGEEVAGAKLAELAPRLGEAAAPLARLGVSSLGSGAVNKLQGGGFGTGAAAGGIGGVIGEGLRSVAPKIAESALNIRKLDRAYGKGGGSIGRTVLDETTGFRPGSVAESAQNRLDELNPQLNEAVDRASVRPNQLRGLLPAPAEEIPLGGTMAPYDMPGELLYAEQFPPQNVGEARVIRNPKGQILPRVDRNVEFPDESGKLPFGRNPKGQILGRVPTRRAFMAGTGDELLDSPELSGPGVLLRRPEVGSTAIPDAIPARGASLLPARNVLKGAFGTATRQGERTTSSQLQPLLTHLTEDISGEPIPENITPRQLLDLKRGFGNEFIHRWNPETMTGVKGSAAQTYHALGDELNRVVPEAQELNGRISRLIPIAKRGESAELNAPTTQRILHRVGAHTGAMATGLVGGYQGYEKGGVPGAIAGGILGTAVPEAVASPTGEMVTARLFNHSAPLLRGLTGSGLQLTRNKNKKANRN